MKELIINPEEVRKAVLNCLYKEKELKNGIPKEAIISKGITKKFALHPGRLEKKRSNVIKWLKALPHQFRKNGGGGWYLPSACYQENGALWTSVRQRIEELFYLAVGLGLAKCCASRIFFSDFPGGMPCYTIYV